MNKFNRKFYTTLLILALFIIIFSFLALNLGKVNLFNLSDESIKNTILLKIRLPRIILAVSAGCILSVSGATLQSLLNNPLADSYTLGISSGAALGACFTIYLNIAFEKNIPVQFNAILFSILALVIVIKIAGSKGRITISNLILAGIIVSTVSQAGVSFFKSIAEEDAVSMINWLMGNLSSKSIKQVLFLLVIAFLGSGICFKYAKELNIMTMGRKEAVLVGVNYDFINKFLLIICALMTAMCVSLCGIIGFLGLVVPHLTRLLVGADNKEVIPISALMGAGLLLLADTATRTMLPHELPVGVLTTLIGGPFFCYIFINRKEMI